MNPIELFNKIYLGDRSIKKIIIDGYNEKIAIQIDLISKIPDEKTTWDYYSDEDIEDGYLIFDCAKAIKISPLGAIADDYISSVNIVKKNNNFSAKISVGGHDSNQQRCEVIIEIEFLKLLLEKSYE